LLNGHLAIYIWPCSIALYLYHILSRGVALSGVDIQGE